MSAYSLVQPARVSGGKFLVSSLLTNNYIGYFVKSATKTKEDIFKKINSIVEASTFKPDADIDLTKEGLESVVETQMAVYVAKIAKKIAGAVLVQIV